MDFLRWLRQRSSSSKPTKPSSQIFNAFISPKLPNDVHHETSYSHLPIPGRFPSTPPESPGLKPIDPYGATTEQADALPEGWEPMDIDHSIQPALVTDLGPHLHPSWVSHPHLPPTPKRKPSPSPPKTIARRQDDRMEIDDPWEKDAREYAKKPHGPVSAVQLFKPIPQPIPANRVASWYAPKYEKLEKERKARELDGQRPSRVRPSGPPVRMLSPEWLARVQTAMQSKQNHAVATSLAGDEIYQRDIATCLRPLAWLNDEIINSYLGLLIHYLRQSNGNLGPNDRPRFHSFNTFFYSTLRDKGYQGVRRWANRAKIGGEGLLNVDTVFIPIHESSHWTLMVVRPVDRTIEYFDSLGARGARQVKTVKEWLRGELGSKYNEKEWTFLSSASSQQDNGSDCGVFLLTNAKAIAIGVEPTAFGPNDTQLLRRKIVAELMNGGLHNDFVPLDSAGTLLL